MAPVFLIFPVLCRVKSFFLYNQSTLLFWWVSFCFPCYVDVFHKFFSGTEVINPSWCQSFSPDIPYMHTQCVFENKIITIVQFPSSDALRHSVFSLCRQSFAYQIVDFSFSAEDHVILNNLPSLPTSIRSPPIPYCLHNMSFSTISILSFLVHC